MQRDMKLPDNFTKNRLSIPLLLMLFLCLLASRRWQQLISPQVWVEDGAQILYGYINYGWLTFFEPVNGYLILVPKIISGISLGISITYYPLISTIFSWFFIALVGMAIALVPTKLKGRVFCAISAFIIPSDPEVFGLSVYTFWWASLLLFLVVLWNEKHSSTGLRVSFLLLGGLSSPVIMLVLPVLYFRAYWYRSLYSERVVAVLATVIAAVQGFYIFKVSASSVPPLDSMLTNVVPTFFGRFISGNFTDNAAWLWCAGLLLIGIIVAWIFRDRSNLTAWILLYLLFGSIALTISRVDPAIIHQVVAGPRYFFFTFILLFWILIQCFCADSSSRYRWFIGIVSATAVTNAIPAWSRQHDDLRWAEHFHSCRFFKSYNIPFQYDGYRSWTWSIKMAGKTCTELLNRDYFFSEKDNERPAFAYNVLKDEVGDENLENAEFVSSTIMGSDYSKSTLKGYRVIGTHITTDMDTGEVLLKLRRGEQLLYRSGPGQEGQSLSIVGYEHDFITRLPAANAKDWVILDFSNVNLPDQFFIEIKDEGRGWGEWSAVAIKN